MTPDPREPVSCSLLFWVLVLVAGVLVGVGVWLNGVLK